MTNKDLIYQYATTGNMIDKYQYDQLPDNIKRSYLRQRFIAAQQSSKLNIKAYELYGAPQPDAQNLVSKITDENLWHVLIETMTLKSFIQLAGERGLQLIKTLQTSKYLEIMRRVYDPEMLIPYMNDIGKEALQKAQGETLCSFMTGLEPLKTLKALGIDPNTAYANLTEDDIDDITRYGMNPDEIFEVLPKQIMKYYHNNMIKQSVYLAFIQTKHPLHVYELLNKQGFMPFNPKFDKLLTFSKGHNVPELIQIYEMMGLDPEAQIRVSDFYDVRRILATLPSIENYNAFAQIMGDKLIFAFKDYTENDFDFILRNMVNRDVRRVIRQAERQYL